MTDNKFDHAMIDTICQKITDLQSFSREVLVVALDGKSGSGKTTISKALVAQLGAAYIYCDDFYTGGGNSYWVTKSIDFKNNNVIDWRRIRDEAIVPLKNRQRASWYPFNWEKFEGLSDSVIAAEPRDIVIVDGAYSSRPELQDLIDYSILVTTPEKDRIARIVKREGAGYSKEWHSTWQAAMEHYFTVIRPPESFDLVVEN